MGLNASSGSCSTFSLLGCRTCVDVFRCFLPFLFPSHLSYGVCFSKPHVLWVELCGLRPSRSTADRIGYTESITTVSLCTGGGGTVQGRERAHPESALSINIVSSCERAERRPPGDSSQCHCIRHISPDTPLTHASVATTPVTLLEPGLNWYVKSSHLIPGCGTLCVCVCVHVGVPVQGFFFFFYLFIFSSTVPFACTHWPEVSGGYFPTLSWCLLDWKTNGGLPARAFPTPEQPWAHQRCLACALQPSLIIKEPLKIAHTDAHLWLHQWFERRRDQKKKKLNSCCGVFVRCFQLRKQRLLNVWH